MGSHEEEGWGCSGRQDTLTPTDSRSLLREGRTARAKVPLCSCKDSKQALSNPPLIACNAPNQSVNWICLI